VGVTRVSPHTDLSEDRVGNISGLGRWVMLVGVGQVHGRECHAHCQMLTAATTSKRVKRVSHSLIV